MSNSKIGIVGAGIQGVCNALFLQKKNFEVHLFDREEPGSAASYGNAGHFSPYASVPLNRPDILTDVPAMLMSSTGPLALKWNYVPKMIPWFFKLVKNCTSKKMMHTAKYMHQILDLALPAYDELFDEIDLDGLVKKNGIMYVWTKKNIASRELEIKIRDQLGVEQHLVNPKEISDLELWIDAPSKSRVKTHPIQEYLKQRQSQLRRTLSPQKSTLVSMLELSLALKANTTI